jgi:hypothetical protein
MLLLFQFLTIKYQYLLSMVFLILKLLGNPFPLEWRWGEENLNEFNFTTFNKNRQRLNKKNPSITEGFCIISKKLFNIYFTLSTIALKASG